MLPLWDLLQVKMRELRRGRPLHFFLREFLIATEFSEGLSHIGG